MARELEVWLFAERVGTLALTDGRLNFQYAPNWLSRTATVTLSSSLPLQAEPFDDHHTRPFFAGLLPEGQLRRLIAQQFQVGLRPESGFWPWQSRCRLPRVNCSQTPRVASLAMAWLNKL
ncbi:HipA N-terminal domain-containing protein [Rhodoferax sp.]|uniref:HipA N-terminal domain-containing protein n=1 Tax=Rhodoferax sp. TaxID=50421 RepID=UPI0025D75501|nr:HipA N-terminal domain-containing protein [Rhodoferax sp.]